MAGNANIQISNYTDADGVFHANGCILYTYDADNSDNLTIGPTLPTNLSSYYGFRFDRNSIWMRSSVIDTTPADGIPDATGCGDGDWNQIINEQKVNITVLTFINRNSQCLNTVSNTVYAGTGAPLDTSCPAGATAGFSTTGDLLVETRQIEITITGNVITDVPVTKTLIATVKVRNNRIFTQ
jgi:hypothetical protein